MTGDRRPCAASGVGPAMMSRVTVMTMAAAIERIVTSFIRSHVEHALEELAGAAPARLGLGAAHPEHLAEGERDVAERGEVRVEVEGLEDHADVLADAVEVDAARGDVGAGHADPPPGRLLQPVDAPEQRAL